MYSIDGACDPFTQNNKHFTPEVQIFQPLKSLIRTKRKNLEAKIFHVSTQDLRSKDIKMKQSNKISGEEVHERYPLLHETATNS